MGGVAFYPGRRCYCDHHGVGSTRRSEVPWCRVLAWSTLPSLLQRSSHKVNRLVAQLVHDYFYPSIHIVHKKNHNMLRLSLDKKTYLVIKTPKITLMPTSYGYSMDRKRRVYLGKSEEGVYYTYQCQLQVWVLLEASCPMPEWVLKHHSYLAPYI